ncbi:MAG: type II toxin-antitoxin system VapC family toxin [Actinomycetia bacterium]|nr:type II toxin-antitoxin system VapC family toxin [Actinomycetes bacterium]
MILIDTHVLIWLRAGDARLGPICRTELDRALQESELALSAISFWEIELLRNSGRIELRLETAEWRRRLMDEGLIELPVDGETGIRAASLSGFGGDPADRLIVATALAGHRLVTADRRILQWPGTLAKLDATQ